MAITGVQNPASTYLNKDFRVSSFDASIVTIEMASGLKLQSLKPGVLTDFAVAPRNKQFGTDTTLTIELKVSSELPCQADRSGCILMISNPVRNPFEHVDSQLKFVFDKDKLRCQVVDQVSVSS